MATQARTFERRATRALLLAALWGLLNGGDPDSWLLGVPAILAATVLGEWLEPPEWERFRPFQLISLAVYFFWHSFLGSCDVARRAFDPRLPIAPALLEFAFRLPEAGPSRVVFANLINLMPGSLNAAFHEQGLTIHLLVASPEMQSHLRAMEDRVAAAFGIPLPPLESPEDAGG